MNVSCRRVLSLPPALPPSSSRSASWEPGRNRVRFHAAATPNAPDSHFPNGMNRPQPQKELREDVSRRYGTVSELKEQVKKTNANSMPSAWLLHKARCEKPAQQVKDPAKGSSSISFVFMANSVNASSAARKSSSTCFSLTSLYRRKKVVLA